MLNNSRCLTRSLHICVKWVSYSDVFIQLVMGRCENDILAPESCCFRKTGCHKLNKLITWYCLRPCRPRSLGRVPLSAEKMSEIHSSTIWYLTIFPSWGNNRNVSGITSYLLIKKSSLNVIAKNFDDAGSAPKPIGCLAVCCQHRLHLNWNYLKHST